MKNYLEHVETVADYTDVLETVKTLEKISASVLHSLKSEIETVRQYREQLAQVRARLKTRERQWPAGALHTDRTLTVIMSGTMGLTGDLWLRLRKHQLVQEAILGEVIVIGGKATSESVFGTQAEWIAFADHIPTDEELRQITDRIVTGAAAGSYDVVSIIYYESDTIGAQKVVRQQLFPVVIEEAVAMRVASTGATSGWPIIDGRVTDLLSALDRLYVKSVLRVAALETYYTANAVRTLTLEHAATKTEDLITAEEKMFRRMKRRADTNRQLEQFVSHHHTQV